MEVDAVRRAIAVEEVHLYCQSWGDVVALGHVLSASKHVDSFRSPHTFADLKSARESLCDAP